MTLTCSVCANPASRPVAPDPHASFDATPPLAAQETALAGTNTGQETGARDLSSSAMTCLDCPTPLARTNKSGRCSPCGNRHRESDPEFRARRVAGIRKAMENPERRKVAVETMRRAGRAALANPKHRAWMVEHGKRLARDVLRRPDVMEKTKAAVSKARKLRAERDLAWCPPEYRGMLERLKRSKKMPAAEAKAAILAQMTPFERQMARVAAGARLVEAFRPVRADYAMTLAGVSGGML
jgi:hypothetical protein